MSKNNGDKNVAVKTFRKINNKEGRGDGGGGK